MKCVSQQDETDKACVCLCVSVRCFVCIMCIGIYDLVSLQVCVYFILIVLLLLTFMCTFVYVCVVAKMFIDG